jgi:hypothetical protein
MIPVNREFLHSEIADFAEGGWIVAWRPRVYRQRLGLRLTAADEMLSVAPEAWTR